MHFIANCRKLVQEKKLSAKVLTNDQAETIKNFLLEDHQKYMKWLKEQKEQSSDDEEDEEESEDGKLSLKGQRRQGQVGRKLLRR